MLAALTFPADRVKRRSAIGAVTLTGAGAGAGVMSPRRPLALACPERNWSGLVHSDNISLILGGSQGRSSAFVAAVRQQAPVLDSCSTNVGGMLIPRGILHFQRLKRPAIFTYKGPSRHMAISVQQIRLHALRKFAVTVREKLV